MEVDGVALRRERMREDGVVRVVLLVERARDGRRHGSSPVDSAEYGAHEAVDTGEAGKAALLRVGAAPEEAAGLEEEAGERTRLEPVGVEKRERAEARADADPPSAAELVECHDECPSVSGRR